MKKLYPLLSVLFLIYWGCDDPKEENLPTPVTMYDYEIQESLIEIEEAEPEPPEEELDEFELRLKQLRDRRR